MSNDPRHDAACGDCPIGASRRLFLRDVGLAVVAALAGGMSAPGVALAERVTEMRPTRVAGARRAYDLPATDAIAVDTDDEVILARWQNRVYAFSLRCPHRGARLRWLADERRIYCPKHKARFSPEGAHVSGRRTRDLDRFDITRSGSQVVVDLGALRRADEAPAAWRAAVVAVG